ncbi:M48 family metalloprotease [Azospirillum sp. Marseille-Q6669]
MQVNTALRRPLVPVLLGLTLLSGGCKSLDTLTTELSGKRTYESVPARFVEVAEQRRLPDAGGGSMAALAASLQKPSGASARSLDGRDPLPPGTRELAGAEPLQRYANQVLARLLKAWPHAKPSVTIVVTNNPAYVAEAVPANTILISQGVFVNSENEDELAFILAHEVSHLLLNHMDADREHAAQKTVEDTGMGALLSAAPRSNPEMARNATLIYTSYRAFQDTVAHPSWARQQEDEADLLGFDLLEKAGYNTNVFQVVMERFADDARKQSAKAEEERKRLEDQINALMVSRQYSAGINAAFKELSAGPAKILGEIGKQLRVGHNSAEQRFADLSDYAVREQLFESAARDKNTVGYEKAVFQGSALKALSRSVLVQRADSLIANERLTEAEAALKEVAKGGFESDPYLRITYYRLHTKQNRPDLAVKDLEIAVKSASAPLEAFDLLIAEHRAAGRASQALAALDARERRFGGGERGYPLRIRLLVEAGRMPEAGAVVERCRAMRGPLVRECEDAWSQATVASLSRLQ